MLMRMLRDKRSILAWMLLVVLCTAAAFHVDDCLDRLRSKTIRLPWLAVMMAGIVASFMVQGLLTRRLCSFCGKRVPWSTCVWINSKGSLMSVVIPYGAAGYKAVCLKMRYGIGYAEYAGFQGLSGLSVIMASLLVLAVGLSLGAGRSGSLPLLVVPGMVPLAFLLPFCARFLASLLPGRHKAHPLFSALTADGLGSRLGMLVLLQVFGMLAYAIIYHGAIRALSADMPVGTPLVLVPAQNVLMMVNIVPGNLVILESMIGWLAEWNGGNTLDGVLVALLIRLVSLMMSMVLGGWATLVLARDSGPDGILKPAAGMGKGERDG